MGSSGGRDARAAWCTTNSSLTAWVTNQLRKGLRLSPLHVSGVLFHSSTWHDDAAALGIPVVGGYRPHRGTRCNQTLALAAGDAPGQNTMEPHRQFQGHARRFRRPHSLPKQVRHVEVYSGNSLLEKVTGASA